MKFLLLTHEDCAGATSKLKSAIDSVNGHSAHAVNTHRTRPNYPEDVFRPTPAVLHELRRWADVIVMFDGWNRELEIASKKRLAVVYNGSAYRNGWAGLNKRDKDAGIVQFGTTIDLTCQKYGSALSWLPVPMGKIETSVKKTVGTYHVVHTPARMGGLKSSEWISEELSGLDGVTLEIVSRVTNDECIGRKSSAHLLIDQFYAGYGVNAIEAWALGMPVIANAVGIPKEYYLGCPDGDEMLAKYKEWTGLDKYPFIPIDIREKGILRSVVSDISSGKLSIEKDRLRGIDFFDRFHSPASVVKRLVDAVSK